MLRFYKMNTLQGWTIANWIFSCLVVVVGGCYCWLGAVAHTTLWYDEKSKFLFLIF